MDQETTKPIRLNPSPFMYSHEYFTIDEPRCIVKKCTFPNNPIIYLFFVYENISRSPIFRIGSNEMYLADSSRHRKGYFTQSQIDGMINGIEEYQTRVIK